MSVPTRYATHCAGCGGELLPDEGKSEFVEANGATRRWHDRCYAARAEYLSMTLSPEYGMVGEKPRRTYHEHSPWEYAASHYDDDTSDTFGPFYQGMTESEFLGDVGDK